MEAAGLERGLAGREVPAVPRVSSGGTPSNRLPASLIPNSDLVYIDTNLDTHSALVVSDLDTISDLKKVILSEHPSCFSEIGQIQIHAITVKRREYFYHVPDSMPVKSCFTAVQEKLLSVECAGDEYAVRDIKDNRNVCKETSLIPVSCAEKTWKRKCKRKPKWKRERERKRSLSVGMFKVETGIQKDDVEYKQDHVDNASGHILLDQQKIKNSNVDQSAEHFDDTDPLKGKNNSSNSHETPVVFSSRKDEEADLSSIQRGVQEKTSEDNLFSKDISMNKATIDNMETETYACKEGCQSTERTTCD